MKYLFALLLVAALAGCSPEIRTYTDYDRQYQVQQFKTYSWVSGQPKGERNILYYNELNEKRIKSAVNDLMRAKGYILTTDSPELLIDYKIGVEEHSVLGPDPYGYMYLDYWMAPRENVFKYREGTLVLDFFKSDSKELVWRGWAVAALEVIFQDNKNIESVIRSAVTKILINFPDAQVRESTELTVNQK